MTTAQSGLSMSASQAYREKMFNLLANRDPLEVLAQTASTLADIVGKHSATILRTRPFEGKWTPNEIIGHLTDSEWVDGYRLRLILCENDPTILAPSRICGSPPFGAMSASRWSLSKPFGPCACSIWHCGDERHRRI